LAASVSFIQMLGLNFEQASFDRGGAAQSPKQTCQPQDQFPLYRRLGIIISDDGGLEGFVVFSILQRADDGLGRQPMANRIAAGMLLAFLRTWTCALARILAIGLDLFEGPISSGLATTVIALLRVVIMQAEDVQTNPRTIKFCYPDDSLVMRIEALQSSRLKREAEVFRRLPVRHFTSVAGSSRARPAIDC
jgi:hypothetical protein